MIEIVTSKIGARVLRLNGRYLASSIDPVREATMWAERARELVKDRATVFVVGLACGYHVAALKNSISSETKVLALEWNEDTAKLALEFNPTLTRDDIVVNTDLLAWTAHEGVKDALLAGPYSILMHQPTLQANEAWAKETERLLLARDKTSFLLQLRLRPELFAHLDAKKIESLGPEAISIKTMQSLFAKSSKIDSNERRLWRVLEELVL